MLAFARKLVPEVDITIWLRTEPSVAQERDQEFHATYYEERFLLYQAAADEYCWHMVPTMGRSPEAVFAPPVG
ncbi:MAG TPA: hypothetical protein VFZ66_02965 [Herpetosiphonaceae bacterium]